MSSKTLKTITQALLLSVIAITPFVKVSSLYFPFVSARVYLFRLLVMLAFFFWAWFLIQDTRYKMQDTNKKQATNSKFQNIKDFLPFRNILVIALLLFFLAQVLVSFFGVDRLFSFFSSISRSDGVFQYGFWLLYFLMLISIFKSWQDWKILFSVFIVATFLISIFAWLGFPPDREIYGNLFGNPAYFSGFLIFAIGFSLLVWGFHPASRGGAGRKFFENPLLNNLFLVLAIFFAITLIVTQIRGAFIGLTGGIFLFCLLSILFLRKTNQKLAYFTGIILIVSAISLISLFVFKDTAFVKNNSILSRITTIMDIREPGSARERLLVWQIALKAIYEKPIFGWGPENFASAFNKYYNHWVGEREAWFDRAHNIPLDILAGGGIFLFSFYLFWLFATICLIFKIGKEKKILSFILASTFFGYFLQGLFFFDTFATSLGLLPFLAFLVFLTSDNNISVNQRINQRNFSGYVLIPAALFSLFIIYTTVIMPYKANAAALNFYAYTEAGLYQEARPFLEKSFSIKSPYTCWEVRKESGWQFLRILEDRVGETMPAKDIQKIEEIYDFITPELEKFIANKPYEPQMYCILARIYQAGFEKLNKDDLVKAEIVLKKALNISNLRKEYFQELKQVLMAQGKFEEAEKLLLDYVKRVNFYPYYPYLTMGHFYFEIEKYQLAIEQYQKAEEEGYDFCHLPAEYSRYMSSAEKTGEYQRIIDMAKKCLEKWGPDADTYFNIAVGYFHLAEKEKAREFFLKAVELKPEYEQYRQFFLD